MRSVRTVIPNGSLELCPENHLEDIVRRRLWFWEFVDLGTEGSHPTSIPRYYKCGSPRATFENRFFFSIPNCKYHQPLNINAIV